ncbi:MAG: hypothetical protein NTV49_14285 [Kiritimatiellaeota bacterium]|nr:hypothetical protein [Kiritimatiellota bacterium]
MLILFYAMRSAKTILGSLAVSVAVWGLFAWPLPRHFMTAIPASAHHRWPAEVRPTMPGDHLQFLYYCWLTSDWLAGRTPACNNLYEFNTGDDQAGFRLDSYYAPFSLVYSLGAWLGGRAFGWNLTGLLSLWLTYLLTLLLVRRYTASAIIPWLAALLSITPTFRWINLAGGSPAGFALAWVPAAFLGLDLAIRDRRARGGWLAGLAVLGAACGDRHVFFFSMLAAPGWCVVAALAAAEWPGKSWPLFRQTLRALLPLAALVVLALALPAILHAGTRLLSGQEPVALTAGTRSMRDVMNYSPEWTGYWGLSPLGISDQIYLGYTVSALLLGGWLHLLWGMVRRRGTPPIRAFILLTAIGLGLGLAMVLALGARSIMDARLFQLVRRVIPYYTLIRQPAKILCLLPTLLAVGAGLSLAALSELFRQRAVRLILATLLRRLLPDCCSGNMPAGPTRRSRGWPPSRRRTPPSRPTRPKRGLRRTRW